MTDLQESGKPGRDDYLEMAADLEQRIRGTVQVINTQGMIVFEITANDFRQMADNPEEPRFVEIYQATKKLISPAAATSLVNLSRGEHMVDDDRIPNPD